MDDAVVADADGFTNTQVKLVDAGVYTIAQEEWSRYWRLTNIVCTPAEKSVVDLANRQALITVNVGEAVTCTFVNQSMGGITVGVFEDSNQNGVRNPNLGEGWLNGWRFTLYDAAGQPVGEPVISSGTGITMGRASFVKVLPGDYTICEDLNAMSGWTNTLPGTTTATYSNQPCRTVTVLAHKTAFMRFGNSQSAVASALQAPTDQSDIIYLDLEEEDTDGNILAITEPEWPEPTAVQFLLFLPVVQR